MSISTMKDKLKQNAQATANKAKAAAQKQSQAPKTNPKANNKSTDTKRNGRPAAKTAAKKVAQKTGNAVKTGSATPAKRVGKQAARTVAKKPQMQKAAQTEKGMQRTIDQTRFVRDMAARSAVQERSIARNRFLPQQPSGVMDRLGLQKYYEKGREENNPSTPIGMVKTTLSDTALDRVLLNDELSRKGYGLTGTPVPVQDILRASAGLAPLDLLTADSVSKAYFGRGAGVKSKQKEKTGKEKALDAAAKVKEHVRQGGARQQTTSRYDNRLKQQYREEIKLAKEDFEAAQRRGDAAGMAEAHERAETWRRIGGGFSGGADGSQYITPEISEEDKKILNKEGIAKLSAAKLGYMNAETDEDRARYAAMGDVVRGNPEYWKDTFSRGAYRNTDAEGRMRYGGTKEEREKEREQLTAIPKAIGTSLAGSFLSIPGTRLRALQEDASNNQGFLQNLSDIRGGGEVNVSKPEKQKTPEEMLAALFQDERYQNASPALKAKKLARTLADIKEEIPLNQRLLKKSQHHYKVATEDLNALEKSLTEAIIAGGEMIPSIVATWLSGGAALPGLATMYTQVSSKEMANQEMMGKDPLESYYRGVTQGAAETIPEALPWLRMLRMAGGTGGKFGREMGKLITENVLSDETSNFLGNAANKYIFKDEDAKVFDKDEILNTAAVSTFMALGMGTGAGMLGAKRGGRTGRQTEREAKTITAMDRVTPSVDELAEQEAALQAQVDTWKMQARRLLDRLQDSTQDPTWHKHLLNELSQHRAQFETLQQQLVGLEMQKAQRAQVEQEKAQQAQRQAEEARTQEQARQEQAQAVLEQAAQGRRSVLPAARVQAPLPLNVPARQGVPQEAPQQPQAAPAATQVTEPAQQQEPAQTQETPRVTSAQYGAPENHIDNRAAENLGDRRVKAFQWDHPEIKPFYQEAAQALKTEVEASLASRQTVRGSNKDRALGRKTGTLMARNEPLRKLHDLGLSSTDILKACDALISDHGQENVKAAKLVELALDDMLSNGYTPVEAGGNPDARIGANQDYIRTKEGIAGGVAQGSFEQVLRDNALPLELGEVTEEELRAEWEAAQGQKNTPPEAEESVQPERPHHPKGTDFNALVEQLQNNLEDLNNMEPVAVLDGTEIPKEGRATERVFSFLNRIGMSVLRPGFGDVLFSKNKIKSSFIGHGVSDAKIELMAGVPEVISKGDQIGFEPNWKGRGYDSYVFAGPVMYKGSPRIIGVIVNEYKGRGNKYYLHEVVDQNGDLIYGEKKEPEATSDGRTQGSGTVVTSDSETSIPQQDQNSNGNFAETTESSFQSEEEELADLQDRMEILMEEAETDGFNQEFFNEQLARMLAEERTIREKWANRVRENEPERSGEFDDEAENASDRDHYSVGAAPSGFDPYSRMANEYGTIEPGENPARMVDVPVSTNGEDRVRRGIRTIMEAGITPDEAIQAFEEEVVKGTFSYNPRKDKASLEAATQTLEDKGYYGALNQWEDVVEGRRAASKDDIVLAQFLYAEAARSKDFDTMRSLAAQIAAEATVSGQKIQAMRLLKKATPEGKLYYIHKITNKIQQELEAGRGDKAPTLEINPELEKALLDAETEEEQRDALDQIYDDVARQIPGTLGDRLNAWRYFAMLGNPRTHIRNVVGNIVVQAPLQVSNKASALVQAALPREKRTRAVVASRAAKRFAREDYRQMMDVLSGDKYSSEETEIRRRQKLFPSPIQAAMDFNSKALEAEDMLFKRGTYIQSLASFITARGWDPANLTESQLEQARTHAVKDAKHATFQNESALASAIAKLENKNKVTKVAIGGLVPFKGVPINIAKMGFDLSPAGLAKAITYDAAQVKKGNMDATDMIDHLTRGLTGTSIAALGYFLAAQGWLTAGADDDDKENYFNMAQGSQEYALDLGDFSYTIDWAAPSAIPLFLGAEYFNARQKWGEESEDESKAFKDGLESLSRLFDPMLNMTVLSGVSDTLNTISYSQTNPLFPLAWGIAQNYAGQFVPTLSGQIARTVDDTRRTTYVDRERPIPNSIQRFIQRQENKIPGLSQRNLPYLDSWGREDRTESPLLRAFENFLSPGYAAKKNTTAVDAELARLNEAGFDGMLPVKAKASTKVNDAYLSAQDYEALVKTQGKTSMDLLMDAVQSDAYQGMTDEAKAAYVKKIFDYAKTKGKQAAGEVPGKAPSWIAKLDQAAKDSGTGVSALLRASMQVEATGDADGNGSIKTEEAWKAIQGMDTSDNEKRALFDLYNGTKQSYDEYAETAKKAQEKAEKEAAAAEKANTILGSSAAVDADTFHTEVEAIGGYNSMSYTNFFDTMDKLGIPEAERANYYEIVQSYKGHPWKKTYAQAKKYKGR